MKPFNRYSLTFLVNMNLDFKYARKNKSIYRTSAGAEIDLVLRRGRRTLAFEMKSSTVPKVSKGFWHALDDITPDEAQVVAPVPDAYPLKGGVMVRPLPEVIAGLMSD